MRKGEPQADGQGGEERRSRVTQAHRRTLKLHTKAIAAIDADQTCDHGSARRGELAGGAGQVDCLAPARWPGFPTLSNQPILSSHQHRHCY